MQDHSIIPVGFCQCGCGGKTSVYRGAPRRFLSHHYRPITLAMDFWSHIDMTGNCWIWLAGKDGEGYGVVSVNNKQVKAHRFAYQSAFGPLTADKPFVLHSCDNPSCVNPAHLFAGTNKDNMDDMNRKGRHARQFGDQNPARMHPERMPRGEGHGNTKLSDVQVRAIRSSYALGAITLRELGRQYNVSFQCIGLIIVRKRWNHI